METTPLQRTPLYEEHARAGAKLVPFAGYEMPVQYASGILTEHKWTREKAGLFDVSHMGQALLSGADYETLARTLEKLVPADIVSLVPGQQRYSQFLNEAGGILDDLMITRLQAKEGREEIYLVVNASRKDHDFAHIRAHLPNGLKLTILSDRSLLALQGPAAAKILAKLNPDAASIPFMHSASLKLEGIPVHISHSGYTGEDGYEISVANTDSVKLWQKLLAQPDVKPIGLGARDSLRLEAGLCLYGHDIGESINPVEADLLWSIQKRRRTEGGFIGAQAVLSALGQGPKIKRVGIQPEGRAPAREGTEITDMTGRVIGRITSGGFGPTVNGPVAMGYVESDFASPGTKVGLRVRGQTLPAHIVKLPFVLHNYKR